MALGANKAALLGAAGSSTTSAFTIDQSIRFNTGDNPFMGRTPSATGNEETWTWSFWVKRANLGTLQVLFQIGADKNNCDQFYFNSSDQLAYNHLDSGSTTDSLVTTQLFRDISAWYHIVLTADITHPVDTERIRIYVNGKRVTAFDGTPNYPIKDTPTDVNTQVLHQIGAQLSATYYSFDGYMAEIVLLDGTATTCNIFGEFNSSGIWIPKDVSGLTFGTNGFHIDGRDATGTPVKLGDDEAGTNNYTTSGMDASDQQPDSPTNNHCTWNSLEAETLITYSNGNLAINYSGSSGRNAARSTIQIPASTDAFFEMVITSNLGSGVDFFIGIEDGTAQSDNSNSIYNNAYIIREDGSFLDQGSRDYSYGVSFTNTDVIGVWRKANGDLVFYKDGAAMNSGTPAKTGLTGTMFFVAGPFNGASAEARFASSKWTNKPSGVTDSMALNTSNLGS